MRLEGGRGTLLKKGFPFPLQTSPFPSQDFYVYRIPYGGFPVRDKFFFNSSFLKNKTARNHFQGRFFFSFTFRRGTPAKVQLSRRLPLRKF